MSMSESEWIHRAQTAEARQKTLEQNMDRMKTKVRNVLDSLCARELSDGGFDIDFMALAAKLPLDQALELRASIDEVHRISGGPGEKPRIKLPSKAAS